MGRAKGDQFESRFFYFFAFAHNLDEETDLGLVAAVVGLPVVSS